MGISQPCLKFFRIWWLSCNIWSICSVRVLCQCTIHMIHEEHMLIYFHDCHEPIFLFLVVEMVFNWSWICQIFVYHRIYLDWLLICASYSEWLLLDTRVYPKGEIWSIYWQWTILQQNGYWMFVSFVQLDCSGEYLVEPTDSQFLLWRLWMRMLEASLSIFWKHGFKPLVDRLLYNVLYAFKIDNLSQFFIAYVRMALISYS